MIKSLFKHVVGFLSDIASLKSFITAVSVAGAFAVGFALAWAIKDDALNKYKDAQEVSNAKIAQTYVQNVKALNSRIQSLESQGADTSKDAQKTVDKYIDVIVPEVVKENPKDYQCVVPASGMQILHDSAVELNAQRGGGSVH